MLYVTADEPRIQGALDKAHAMLKAARFSYKQGLASATFTRHYEHPGRKQVVEITGWHGGGTGNRNYGNGMTVHDLYVGDNAVQHPRGMYVPHSQNQRAVNVGAALLGEFALNELYDYVSAWPHSNTIWKTADARDAALKDIDSIPEKIQEFLKKA